MNRDELANIVQRNLLMPHAKLAEVLIPAGVTHEQLQHVIAIHHLIIAVAWMKTNLGVENTAAFLEGRAMELRGQAETPPDPGQGDAAPNVTPMRKEPKGKT